MHGHRHTRHESGWDAGWGGWGGATGGGGGFGPGRGPWGGPGGPGPGGRGRPGPPPGVADLVRHVGGPGVGGECGGRPGPPPWVADLVRHFGGPGFGGEFGGRRGPRARRGDVRAAILDVLAGDEMNGYQLIQQISERTGGAWKPSPGSVYPTVQQLEDEGLVEGREVDGRRLLRLTDAGRAYVEENAEEMAATWRPFEAPADDEETPRQPGGSGDLMPLVGQVMGGMWQIVTTGTSQQRAEAAEVLTETRRKLYRLLADGDPE